MKTTSTIGKRIAAAVGALAVGVAGLALGAGAANAAPSPANIASTPGTLTIHKYAGDLGSTSNKAGSNDGTKLSDTDTAKLGTALAGVKFVIRSVQVRQTDGTYKDIDLNSYEGWELYKTVDLSKFDPVKYSETGMPAGDTSQFHLGWTSGELTTGNDGSVSKGDLAHTLYYVYESDASGAKDANGTAMNVVKKSQPFLVTVPFPAQHNSDQWIYDIHAYPKNEIANKPTKAVDDPGNETAVGDTVNWNIKVPLLQDGGNYKTFVVKDQLDADHLKANTKDVVVTLSDGATPTPNVTTLTRNADYTITPAQDQEAAVAGTPIVVTLTSAGLTKINAVRANKSSFVNVKIGTTVKALSTDGTIKNTGETITNNGTSDVDQTTNVAQVNHGSVKLTKTSKIEGKVLAGAQFELWTAKADGSIGSKVSDTIYTTGEDGTLQIDGIWTGTSITGDKTTTRDYYLKEVKAPAGYVLPENTNTKVTVKTNGIATPVAVSVTNEQNNGPNLPLTGSAGTILLLAVGTALVLGGTVTSQIARKNRKSAQVR